MNEKPSNHIYGGADDDNRQPPPPNGLRGEGAPSGAKDDMNTRTVGKLTISETSGTAAAEVSDASTDTGDDR